MATLVQVNEVSKAYGPRVIFERASITITEKQKIGVIGRNGAGKSTLFNMIVGKDAPDTGSIFLHDIARLSYLEQHDEHTAEETVLDFLLRKSGQPEWRVAKVAAEFQLTKELLAKAMSALSGGYQMRAKLTAMLLPNPNLILLDEPTNYLDLNTLLLLEKFLQNYHEAFLVISHDREFLKNTCEQTMDVDHGGLELYPGPIEEFLAYKHEQLIMKEYYNKKIDREQKHLQEFVDRFRYKASKASQAQSKLKQIARLQKIEILESLPTARIAIPIGEIRKGLALRTNELRIGYPDRTVAEQINIDIDCGERVAILGDNGQGKTTLLKTLAEELTPLAGTMKFGHRLNVGYYAQHVPSQLAPNQTVKKYLENHAAPGLLEQDILAMAGNFLFKKDDVDKSVGMLSGGERARLCLAGLLLGNYNLLLLDEPTNHPDFETVESLGRALAAYKGTIFFISHNRTFVNVAASSILEVKNGHVLRYPGTYEEYVYHLEQMLEPEEETSDAKAAVKKNKEDNAELKEAQKLQSDPARLKYEEARALKKKIRGLEEDIIELETKKKSLLKLLEKRPTTFTPEQYRELGDVSRQIVWLEEEWMGIQE